MEFFSNLGDWPLSKKGRGDKFPIFSWCGSDDTNDFVMPTYDLTESTLESMSRFVSRQLSLLLLLLQICHLELSKGKLVDQSTSLCVTCSWLILLPSHSLDITHFSELKQVISSEWDGRMGQLQATQRKVQWSTTDLVQTSIFHKQ